ncbi:MAG: AAA-like domain-containing protein [Candidatus Hodarchaeota archaeon]
MRKNPYKFTGPLYPEKDKLICIRRMRELENIIAGIMQGDYWTILGPRQIGKTTFLNQLIYELSGLICIYFDMEICPNTEETFYNWLIDNLSDQTSLTSDIPDQKDRKDFGPELNFYNFLRSIDVTGNHKIVLFFDEIEKTPFVKSFLHLWRKIFNERNYRTELNKYAVIIAGSIDLISLTIGPTSPFNISKKLYLEELTKAESEKLINDPLKEMGVKLDTDAKEELISQTSCHPQLLQHLCYILVELTFKKEKCITKSDVIDAIEKIFVESDNLSALKREVQSNKKLHQLIERIFTGERIQYFSYQDFSISETGPIIQKGEFCAIRNKIYEDFLKKAIQSPPQPPPVNDDKESEYMTTLYLNEFPQQSLSTEANKDFIKYLLMPENVEIELVKNSIKLPQLELELKEKLIFCYMAYLNYKALQIRSISHWKKIPTTYEFRLSSNIENNEKNQIPEWKIFVQALGKEPFGDDIRSWIFSLRNNLNNIDARDIIHSETGRGKGYLFKGIVNIQPKE